jgi:hypothetical protein
MKTKVVIVFVFLSMSSWVLSEPVRGSGATSCGSWIKERKNGTASFDQNWLLGFMSGYNHYKDDRTTKNGIFGSTDNEGIAAWMDNYCEKNPLSDQYSGVIEMIEELRVMRN